MTLNLNLQLYRQCYACCDHTCGLWAILRSINLLNNNNKRLRLELGGFRYKVALILSYLHIKFDGEIEENPLEFQANFRINLHPELN